MKKSRQLLSIVIVFFWASEYCHVPYFTPYLTLLGFSMTAIGFMVGSVWLYTDDCPDSFSVPTQMYPVLIKVWW